MTHIRLALHHLSILASAIVLACAGADAPAANGSAILRDSAGITIVENSAPSWSAESAWRISDTPVLDIGGATSSADSSLWFARISGMHRLSDGTIAVLDGGSYNIRFFSREGRLLGKAGRRGTGPGEFDNRFAVEVTSLRCGTDTVYTMSTGSRLHAFVAPDRFVRTFTLAPVARAEYCLRGKLITFTRNAAWPTTPGVRRDSVKFRLYNLEGDTTFQGLVLPRQDNQWVSGGEGVGYSLLPFGRRMSHAARDDALVTAIGDAFEIEIRDTTLNVKRIARVPGRERPLTNADIDRYKAFVTTDWRGNADELRALNERLLPEKLHRTLPVFGELRIDEAGNIWAREYNSVDAIWFYSFDVVVTGKTRPGSQMDEPTRWTVLNADGVLLGDIQLPARFAVREIGHDWILGIWRDELDVEHVRMYRILKGRG